MPNSSNEEQSAAPGVSKPQAVVALTPMGLSVQRLAVSIHEKRKAVLVKKPKSHPRRSIWASQIPDCTRQGVYEFSHWEQKKQIPWEIFPLFQMGHVNEAEYKRELIALGFELVEDQVHIGDDMFQRYGLSGYLDTKIVWEGRRIPVEMKMMSGHVFDQMNGINPKNMATLTPEFILSGVRSMRRFGHTRKYIRQGLVYMLGTGEEALLFALTNGRGDWKFIVLEFDADEAEQCLQIAESIQKHRKDKTLPDRIGYDNETCGRCPFIHICLPDIENDPSVKLVNNKELEAEIEEWEKLTEKGKRWVKLDKKIKEFGKGNDMQIIGDFLIRDKTGVQKKYDMPSAVKEKYRIKDGVRHTVTVERLATKDPDAAIVEPGRSIVIGAEENREEI